jgi:glutamyl-tRNA reductase
MTTLGCLSVPGCRVPLGLLESLSFTRESLEVALLDQRERTGAEQLFALSTCERIEVYATWDGEPVTDALPRALAGNRGLPLRLVKDASIELSGPQAVRHLLRVTAGLESFVLGESDIVGQVRSAADASRAAGTGGL